MRRPGARRRVAAAMWDKGGEQYPYSKYRTWIIFELESELIRLAILENKNLH
jgi:hypothetical protein